MIKEFFARRRENKAIRNWQRSNLGKALELHTKEYFTGYPRLSSLSEETKNKITGEFYKKVFEITATENPFLAMREYLASLVVEFSELQVLCLTEEEKAESFYADCPYVSGKLYRHIDKAANFVDDLRELKWKNAEISNSDCVSFCNSRCVLYLYYINGFNYIRSEFDDVDREKDWLQPFIKSMLIWSEEQIREKIGMDTLLPNRFDGLKYSTFMNLVVNGHKNPYFEWEKHWSDSVA